MGINTKINSSQGVVRSQGAGGLDVELNPSNTGFSPYALQGGTTNANTLVASYGGTFTIPGPGYYLVSGSTTCTGSVPNPGAYPGAFLMVTLLNQQPCQLSGSATMSAKVFSWSGMAATGSLSGSNPTQKGNLLTLDSGGSCAMFSDGFWWLPFVSSGSLRIGL